MDSAIADEILEELSSTLQRVEAQSAALLEFVKEKGIAREDELAPYFERANAASSVRWLAIRVRLGHLLAGVEKSEQQAKAHEKQEQGEKSDAREKADDRERAKVLSDPSLPKKSEDGEGKTDKAEAKEGAEKAQDRNKSVRAERRDTPDQVDFRDQKNRTEISKPQSGNKEQASDKAGTKEKNNRSDASNPKKGNKEQLPISGTESEASGLTAESAPGSKDTAPTRDTEPRNVPAESEQRKAS